LQHLFAGPCHLRPTGFRVRVLLQASDIFTFEGEIDLTQAALGGSANGKTLFAKRKGLGILDESLPPNLNEHVFEREIHLHVLRSRLYAHRVATGDVPELYTKAGLAAITRDPC
jgi:hypothetical protein